MDEPQDRVVGHLAEQPHRALELAWLEPRDQPDGAVEQPDEHEERVSHSRSAAAPGRPDARARRRPRRRPLEDLDDRVALARLALRDHAPEPRQWSPTAWYAVPAGPRRPTRRGSAMRSTRPHDSASARARLAARWDSPRASRTSRSVSGSRGPSGRRGRARSPARRPRPRPSRPTRPRAAAGCPRRRATA